MLTDLKISNVILIEEAHITFAEGLNILTGETGAGKSSVMNALGLALGQRAESSFIRKEATKGFVEASFLIVPSSPIWKALDQEEIHYSLEEPLVIRRELACNGKSRAFINDQIVSIALLEIIASQLIDLAGQHSHQKLLSLPNQRVLLDQFGSLQSLLNDVNKSWQEEVSLRDKVKDLQAGSQARLREMDTCRLELEELQSVKLKDGEEEELFSEYSRLSHSEELTTKSNEILALLSEGKQPLLTTLNRIKSLLEHISTLDNTLEDSVLAIQNMQTEMSDLAYTLERYRNKMDANPYRLEELNQRLSLINRLKRKYGKTMGEIQLYRDQLECKLAELLSLDDEIPLLQNKLKMLEDHGISLSTQLTQRRKAAAETLQALVSKEIQALNMPKAHFEIRITLQPRGPSGADKIEFFFSPNPGEPSISLKDCASGGELSRLFLAIKTALAGQDLVYTLIFDEIDANLGGETASIVGEKLSAISKKYQVILITHLPQVATKADHHFQIAKEESDGRTRARIRKLDKQARHQELTRMLGGLSFNSATKDLAEKLLK